MKQSALTIGLSIVIHPHASPEDFAEAHEAIDQYFKVVSKTTVSAVQLQTEGSTSADAAATISANSGGSSVELDKDGVPWDERIHSGSKAKTEKGVWKKRKGVDDALYTSLTAQLKAQQSSGADTVAAVQTETVAPTGGVSLPGGNVQLPGAAPALPQLQPIAQPEYTELVALIGRNLHSPTNPTGRITDAWVTDSLKQLGVPDGTLQTLAHNPAQVTNVLQQFKALGLV